MSSGVHTLHLCFTIYIFHQKLYISYFFAALFCVAKPPGSKSSLSLPSPGLPPEITILLYFSRFWQIFGILFFPFLVYCNLFLSLRRALPIVLLYLVLHNDWEKNREKENRKKYCGTFWKKIKKTFLLLLESFKENQHASSKFLPCQSQGVSRTSVTMRLSITGQWHAQTF